MQILGVDRKIAERSSSAVESSRKNTKWCSGSQSNGKGGSKVCSGTRDARFGVSILPLRSIAFT
jgi:hypothetical protein